MSRFIRQKLSWLSLFMENPWLAYPAITLLQVKVMLGIWKYRDLAPGDTAYYYSTVFSWLEQGKGTIVRSPVYTLFLAALQGVIGDPFRVLLVARLGMAICGTLLALALLRRLLPKYMAWIIAAWWALLPITFDTAYSVHLFSALFILALFVIAAYRNNIYGRGLVLAGLLLTAVLVRNEYSVLFLLWLVVFSGYEFFLRRRGKGSPSLKTYLLAYGVPLLVVLLVIGGFYVRAKPGGYAAIKKEIEIKQTENMCQIYAFNRKQQGDPWKGNPWLDCESLLKRDFGRASVTFFQTFFLNPRAILQHLWWNFKLIPSGTQLALFNSYAGGPNPDYMRAKKWPLVWVPFGLVLGLCAFGLTTCFILPVLKKRRSFENGFAWLLMLSASLLVLAVMIMQRPRPSYMFPYTLSIMALTGLGLHQLFARLRLDNVIEVVLPAAGVLLILLVPSWYDSNYTNYYGYKGQPLRKGYEHLVKYINDESLDLPAVAITPVGDYTDLCNYLNLTCYTLPGMGTASGEQVKDLVYANIEDLDEKNVDVYVLYLQDMIWQFSSKVTKKKISSMGYVELECYSLADNVLRCKDGKVDLDRGVMNDGKADIPLRAALFVNNGHVVQRKTFDHDQGYFLQIMMENKQIDRILVADERLFRTKFNQRYLLGKFDRSYFEEVIKDFPDLRLLKLKTEETEKPTVDPVPELK